MRRSLLRVVPALLLLAVAVPGAAQEPDTSLVVPERERPLQEEVELPDVDAPASPGGAFLRSLLVPGWGHAAIGAYTRGGFYVTSQASTLWMLVRTTGRLSAARDVRTFRAAVVEERLRARGIDDPIEILDAVDADPDVQAARSLVRSREQQFEDWLALGIFLAFLGGADAFVSAHLSDFPDPVTIGVRPTGNGVEVGASIRIPPTR